MTPRLLLFLVALSPACSPQESAASENDETARLARIDVSFSAFPIGTPLQQARAGLDAEGILTEESEEFWTDREGILHRFTRSGAASDPVLDAKGILLADWAGGPIPAVGIGASRTKDDVLFAIAQFDPALEFQCKLLPGPAPAMEQCRATLDRGEVELLFDKGKTLTMVGLQGRAR